MKWFVYIIECADKSFYTGTTTNITRRLNEHNNNDRLGSRFVRVRRPARLVYQETLRTKSLALRREFEIKRLSRKKKQNLILGHI